MRGKARRTSEARGEYGVTRTLFKVKRNRLTVRGLMNTSKHQQIST